MLLTQKLRFKVQTGVQVEIELDSAGRSPAIARKRIEGSKLIKMLAEISRIKSEYADTMQKMGIEQLTEKL